MSLRDLLSLCAAEYGAHPTSASALWVFTGDGARAHMPVPGPDRTDEDTVTAWGWTLYQAARYVAESIPFVPTALVVLVPDPEGPYLDAAGVGVPPARLLLTPRPVHLIDLRPPVDDSIAARLLEVARRTTTARFT